MRRVLLPIQTAHEPCRYSVYSNLKSGSTAFLIYPSYKLLLLLPNNHAVLPCISIIYCIQYYLV